MSIFAWEIQGAFGKCKVHFSEIPPHQLNYLAITLVACFVSRSTYGITCDLWYTISY